MSKSRDQCVVKYSKKVLFKIKFVNRLNVCCKYYLYLKAVCGNYKIYF